MFARCDGIVRALRHWECVLHALSRSHTSTGITPFAGRVTSLRRHTRVANDKTTPSPYPRPGSCFCGCWRLRRCTLQIISNVNGPARICDAERTKPSQRAFKRKTPFLQQLLMLVMKTINKKEPTLHSPNLWCAPLIRARATFRSGTAKLGAPRLFIYLCIHCTMRPRQRIPFGCWFARDSLLRCACARLYECAHTTRLSRWIEHGKLFAAWKTHACCGLKGKLF